MKRPRRTTIFGLKLNDLDPTTSVRPSPLYFAERLTDHLGGAKGLYEADELNHTGAHKINNVLGQIILRVRYGKKTDHRENRLRGQHGVATGDCLRKVRVCNASFIWVRMTLKRRAPSVVPHASAGGRSIP